MKYFIFKVTPSVGKSYYVLNNRYIGYVGFDSNHIRSILEYHAGVKETYQVFAVSKETEDLTLHKDNCVSRRFTLTEIKQLILAIPVFTKSRDKTVYAVYYPNPNNSVFYLKEVGGKKTILGL